MEGMLFKMGCFQHMINIDLDKGQDGMLWETFLNCNDYNLFFEIENNYYLKIYCFVYTGNCDLKPKYIFEVENENGTEDFFVETFIDLNKLLKEFNPIIELAKLE